MSERNRTIIALCASGLTHGDIAWLFQISRQRVDQIVRAPGRNLARRLRRLGTQQRRAERIARFTEAL